MQKFTCLGLFLAAPLVIGACNGGGSSDTSGTATDSDGTESTTSNTETTTQTTGPTSTTDPTTTTGPSTDSGETETTTDTDTTTATSTSTTGDSTSTTGGATSTSTGGLACEACVAADCPDELNACANDTNCTCWAECQGDQPACIMECGAPNMTTKALDACVTANCAMECGL